MKKNIFYMILGGVLFTTVTVLAYTLNSNEVLYETSDSILDSNSNGYVDVKDALDDLYEKVNTPSGYTEEEYQAAQAACPSTNDCVKKVGEQIQIANENFRVLWSNKYYTALIPEKNVSTSTNRQSDNAETLAFSSTRYWVTDTMPSTLKEEYIINGASFSGSGNPYPYVYNAHSNLYTYVENYKNFLNENGGNKVKEARLATYQELIDLTCDMNHPYRNCPYWINNTYFWTGSAQNYQLLWSMYANKGGYATGYTYETQDKCGVRPVIIVSTWSI